MSTALNAADPKSQRLHNTTVVLSVRCPVKLVVMKDTLPRIGVKQHECLLSELLPLLR